MPSNLLQPKVCILAAGMGTRLAPYSDSVNKALLPLQRKAIISHIIEKFDARTEFVIAVGHLAEQIEAYLTIAHPQHHFTFVQVNPYSGPESGPGYSLEQCSPHLQQPFYLITCDTLWSHHIADHSQNWLAVAKVSPGDSVEYCNVIEQDGRIVAIRDKQPTEGSDSWAWTGLAFIRDFNAYWSGLSKKTKIKNEIQVSLGFGQLIEKGLGYQPISWTDVGRLQTYESLLQAEPDFYFRKTNEIFYHVGTQAIKYFSDPEVTANRATRAMIRPTIFPKLTAHRGHFLAYDWVEGVNLYERTDPATFGKFLEWMEHTVWQAVSVPPPNFPSLCHDFYHRKTLDRLRRYFSTSNGKSDGYTQAAALLGKIDWKALSNGIAIFIHGDLQPGNVIYSNQSCSFRLIDWRQDFSGHLHFGDLYYDLAKLYAGLRLNFEIVAKQGPAFPNRDPRLKQLEEYVRRRGFDLTKIRLLSSIIYLNMSGVHLQPTSDFLFKFGYQSLREQLGLTAEAGNYELAQAR